MTITDNQYYKLGRKTFLVFILQRSTLTFIMICVAALSSVAGYFLKGLAFVNISQFGPIFNLIFKIGLIGAVVVELIAVLIAWLEYKTYTFMIDDDSLKVIRGFFNKEEIALPYRRIENVEIKQPMVYQMLGVSRVDIEMTTDLNAPAGKSGTELTFETIDNDLALAIQEELAKRAETERINIQK